MKINYSPVPGIENSRTLMPIIPINFKHGKYEFSTYALVDSGATGAVISTVMAEHLHINWRELPLSIGFSVGSNFRSHRYNKLRAEIFDHTFRLSVSIIEGISLYRCILGQADVFQRAKITFEGYKKQFEIIFREYN